MHIPCRGVLLLCNVINGSASAWESAVCLSFVWEISIASSLLCGAKQRCCMQFDKAFCLMPLHPCLSIRWAQEEIAVHFHNCRAGSQTSHLWALLTRTVSKGLPPPQSEGCELSSSAESPAEEGLMQRQNKPRLAALLCKKSSSCQGCWMGLLAGLCLK